MIAFQSDANAKITLELVNTQTHRILLEKGQSADSLYGLLKSIAVDGATTYDFSSRATVQPDNTVTIKLDKNVLKAHFKNVMVEEDVFTLVPRHRVQSFSGSFISCHQRTLFCSLRTAHQQHQYLASMVTLLAEEKLGSFPRHDVEYLNADSL